MLSCHQCFRHFFGVLPDLSSACQATVIDSISMNFYIAEPVTRLPLFNFLVRYIFTEVLLESCAVEKIKLACADSPFDASEVELISGQRFPDIVAEKYYGIEVKSTKEDHWTSTGSSILETTRIENVDDIYMLFGKLGGNIPQFKCRPYQDVLYDIAVTHSPRYLINMEISTKDSIFEKMGISYDEFRTSPDSISKVRQYYKEQAKQHKRQEMPWWITSENVESAYSFNIKLWNSLESREKRDLQTKCMILFPEALNPARSMTKYNNTTLWLCSIIKLLIRIFEICIQLVVR